MEKLRLSTSRVQTYLHCPRSYYWNYIENLSPIAKSIPLQVGDFTHIFHQKKAEGQLTEEFVSNLKDYVQEKYPGNSEEETLQVAYESLNLYSGFMTKYKEDIFLIESPEVNLELDMGNFLLYTRLDSLLRDQSGRLWRGELKTTARMDSAYLSGLKGGLQAGISYLVAKEVLPERIYGTVYDIIVKTKVPQYERTQILAEKNLLDMTLGCVTGVANDILSEKFYPSMQCFYYNRECEYLPLCKNDSEVTRKTFYEPRKEFYEQVKV